MAEATAEKHLRLIDADTLRGWSGSLEGVGVMSVSDQMLGGLDGLLVDRTDRPYYLVIRAERAPGQRYLIPIGMTWFDQTTGVIRTDATEKTLAQCPNFDEKSYAQMSPDESWAYERRALAACCPETVGQPGGRLDYYNRLPQFRPPAWLMKP